MNRDETKYSLALSTSKDIPQKSTVGEFYHKDDANFHFYIILDDKTVKNVRHRTMVITNRLDQNKRECGVAYITKDMLTKLQNNDFHISALWHELGHYHNGDFDNSNILDNIAKVRRDHIKNNKVMEAELKADEFACRLWGKNNMIKFLNSAIEERRRLNDNNADLAIKELNLRLQHIRDYNLK